MAAASTPPRNSPSRPEKLPPSCTVQVEALHHPDSASSCWPVYYYGAEIALIRISRRSDARLTNAREAIASGRVPGARARMAARPRRLRIGRAHHAGSIRAISAP